MKVEDHVGLIGTCSECSKQKKYALRRIEQKMQKETNIHLT